MSTDLSKKGNGAGQVVPEETGVRHRGGAPAGPDVDGTDALDTDEGQYVLDGSGGRLMAGGIAIDITDHRRAQEHNNFLFSISDKIRVSRNAEKLLGDIAETLGEYLGLHRCLFNEIDLEKDTETVHLDYSRSDESIAGLYKVSAYSPVSSESMKGGQTVVNFNSQTDPRTADLFETIYGPNQEVAYIAVPMLRNGTWTASLWCSDDKPRTWTSQEISLVENIAERTWSAVERLRTEQILRRNEEMFSTLVEAAPFGVYFIDSDFRLISVNSGAQKVFAGIEPLLQRDFAEILRIVWPEPFATEAIDKFRNTLITGEPYLAPTIVGNRGNAEIVESYDWQIHRITLSDGSYGVVCYFYDLTEQKRLEASVRRTSELNAYRIKLSDALRPRADPEEIQDAAIEVLGEHLGASRVGYGEFHHDSSTVAITRDYTNGSPGFVGSYSYSDLGKELLTELIAGRTVLRSDIGADTDTGESEKKLLLANHIAASAHVPLVKENELVALLFVHFNEPHEWTEEEAALLEETAERTWAAVERAAAEKRGQEQARKTLDAQAKFESVFNQSGIFAAILDLDGRVREINDLAVSACGYSKGEIVGRHFSDTPYWRGSESVQEKLRAAAEGAAAGTVFRARLPYWNADGTERIVEMSMHPIRDHEGKVIFIHPTGVDVTDQKLSEDALRTSEERYRGIVNQAVAGVAEIDLEGRFVSVNDRYCELLGRSRDEILHLSLEEVTLAADYNENRQKIERLISSGKSFEIEKRYVRPDGSPVWVYNTVYAVLGENGRVQSLAAVVVDITERRKAEEALRESEELFSKAFKASPLVLTISSLETGKLLEVNDTFIAVTGFSREEAIGKTTLQLGLWAKPSDRDAELAAVRHQGQLYNAEYEFRLRDGRVIIGLLSAELVEIGGSPCALTVIQDITERKQAAGKLAESEERFRLATEAIQAVIYDWNIAEDTIERSGGIDGLLGFAHGDPETLTNSWWRARLHPDDAGPALSQVDDAITGGKMRFEQEYRILHRNGSYIWVNDVGLMIRDSSGAAVRCVGSVTDITQRKRADEALRESEQRFRYTSDAAPVLIWMSNSSGSFTWVNKGWLDFTGRSMDEEKGSGWTEVIHPEDRERCLAAYNSAFKGPQEFEIEYRLRRANGDYRWVYCKGVPRTAPAGDFLGFIGSCVEIHDRRAAEAALRESQERLRLAQTAGNVGVWDWDIVADRTYWSETMWTFYGEEPMAENPGDEYWAARLHPADRERVKKELAAALKSDAEHYRDEFRVDTGAEQVRWLESIANISRDANGRPTRMYGVNIDITERKFSEERIRHSEAQLRLVTNSMPALIAYIDRQFRYRFVNERYTEWFGMPTNEIVGKKMRDVLGGRAFTVIKPLIAATLAGEPTSVQTTVNYRRAGEKFVQISYIPDVAEDGTVRGLYSLVSDLTNWKRSEEMLRSSEQRVAMLMETVSDYAILSTDANGTIETWNVGAENIFGYSAEEAIGRPVESLFPSEDVLNGAHSAEMHSARLLGRAADERWLVRKDGTRFFASGVMMPLRIGDEINGYVKIVSDLTDKKRRAESLQLAHDELELRVRDRTRDLADVNDALRREIEERERSEAVKIGLLHRIVSAQETERQRIARDIHDQLGQRLTALRLKLAALRDSCHGDGELTSRVERLQEIAQLLDSEVSFLASELRPNTLDDLGLEDALRAHAGDWSRHHEVELEFHSNGLTGKRLDRNTEIQLYRIAQEALNNVAKHAAATQVNLLIEKAADSVVLIVEDDGVGFAVTGRSKRRAAGGLGLVGMRERASLIGASVEIESVEGKGTTVFVRLPIDRTEGKNGG